jgi:hypothetical protein
MTANSLTPCHRCKGLTALPSEIEWRLHALEARVIPAVERPVVLCPECVAELKAIIDRAEGGDVEAKKEFKREQDFEIAP